MILIKLKIEYARYLTSIKKTYFLKAGKRSGPMPEVCFWAVTELGCGQKELAKKLDMTQPGVGYAVIRGEAISKSHHLELKKMS